MGVEAASWSLALGQVGKGLVWVAVAAFLLSAVFSLLAGKRPKMVKPGTLFFWLGSLAIFGTFGCLVTLFVREQFHYEYIFGRSAQGLVVPYRVAAVWSGQQGSFLLWGVCSALFGLIAMPFTGKYRAIYTAVFAIFLGSLASILAYETPFNILKDAIVDGKVMTGFDGQGMTPALQNYWVVIHPPVIFLGFGSLTILYAWAMSAMFNRDVTTWAPMIRPWAILSCTLLGFGLCLGGFWAYETLGWGGFWAWDPVENVSFVPWVIVAVFFHGLIIQITRGRNHSGNLFLAGLPFVLFCFGTLMTRSGALGEASVHSFAQMDRTALQILLGILLVAMFALIGTWFFLGRKLGKAADVPMPAIQGANRESAYRGGLMLLNLIAFITALGMSWPYFTALIQGKAAIIEPHLYHKVLGWFFPPLMLFMAITPFLGWKGTPWRQVASRMANVLGVALALTGGALFMFKNPKWGVHVADKDVINLVGGLQAPTIFWITFLVFLTLFVMVANLWRIVETLRRAPMSIGGFVSHVGLAMLLAGMCISLGLERKERAFVIAGVPTRVIDFTVAYQGMTEDDLFNRENRVKFEMIGDGGRYTAMPGLYYVENPENPDEAMVWPHIKRTPSHDVYFSMQKPVYNLWENPLELKKGQTITQNRVTITFQDFVLPPNPGQPGARFGAKFRVVESGKVYDVTPEMVMTPQGMQPTLLQVNETFYIALMGMSANNGTVSVQMPFVRPVFPVEIYYKPMTILVWSGVFIVTLGGFIAAWYRRYRRTPTATPPASETSEPVPTPELVSTP